MQHGRQAGLITALGVICGSVVWGIIAGLGFAAVIQNFTSSILIIRIVGGVYLLWLAARAFTEIWQPKPLAQASAQQKLNTNLFLRGLGIHMMNPKVMLVWLATISLGITPAALPFSSIIIVLFCAIIGFIVYSAYAFVFSTQIAINFYLKKRRYINIFMCIFYSIIGIRLILLT